MGENAKGPREENVEIEGTEPYIVGGHTSCGYWVDTDRMTTIKGLYAAGDVAGGCPQKYVTGALVEGEIAAVALLKYIEGKENILVKEDEIESQIDYVNKFVCNDKKLFSTNELEEAMQNIMDKYGGGIGNHYKYNETQLNLAEKKLKLSNI